MISDRGMREDMLIKPKEGKQFLVFRSKLMNVPIDRENEKEQTSNGS